MRRPRALRSSSGLKTSLWAIAVVGRRGDTGGVGFKECTRTGEAGCGSGWRVSGVNWSLGYGFDAEAHRCGERERARSDDLDILLGHVKEARQCAIHGRAKGRSVTVDPSPLSLPPHPTATHG